MHKIVWLAMRLLVGISNPASAMPAADDTVTIELRFTDAITAEPFSGRVYLMTTQSVFEEPRRGPNWFKPDPFFAWEVSGWKPNEKRTFTLKDAVSNPNPFKQLPVGTHRMQAVLDRNMGGRNFSTSPGNGYSKPATVKVEADKPWSLTLTIDQVAKESIPQSTERVKFFSIQSKLLSDFYHRRVDLKAGVILPASYASNESQTYPVVFEIPGFGGTHSSAIVRASRKPTQLPGGVEVIWVVLNPDCPLGHHVFADSANNGPVAQAFFDDFLPAFSRAFRAIDKPQARLVTGHSSGGWSSLWLQVRYPDQFAGTWSTAPDPVDFRDFQLINIYQDESMFVDGNGKRRPLARRGGKPVLFYQGFSDMERVMGRGGQLGSFEAVFGPKGSDGKPRELWDRTTGKIDRETAEAWKAYDINLYCKKNWSTIGPKLKGKLHVYTGGADTFYLDGAAALLKTTLAELGSDAKVQIFPGKDHGSVLDRGLVTRISEEMAAALATFAPKDSPTKDLILEKSAKP